MATYRYNKQKTVGDDDTVAFTVTFISDGNTGVTDINIPGEDDPTIDDEGTVSLGLGKDLKSARTIVVSNIANPISQEDDITISYLINGEEIARHTNEKADDNFPVIILKIKFN